MQVNAPFYVKLWTVTSVAKKHSREDQVQITLVQATEEQIQSLMQVTFSEGVE